MLARLAAGGRLSRRELLRRGTAAGLGLSALAPLLAACGGGSTDSATAAAGAAGGAATQASGGSTVADLATQAQSEGQLNVIALPRDWANYGEMIDTFKARYGLQVSEASPDASSAEENEAVKSLKGQDRAPDVLDVGPSFAAEGKADGLYSPYRNTYWDTIPDSMKDADGHWVGDYWGVISFGVNADIAKSAPAAFADLMKSDYKNMVALNGDPREAGAAFAGVYAASLANGGSLDDIMPGIQFFADLKKAGNFIPVGATPATVANGQTPITIDWDYLQIGYGKEFEGKLTWQVQVPSDAVFGNYYCQAISAFAPNPNAAKLWQEFCYSDEGQLIWLKGFAHPARFQDLASRNAVPQELLDKLPPADAYAKVEFPTQEQSDKAKQVLADNWGPLVGA
jgi:putative spermidine/putrescine transport system substrate-binding protein